MDPALIESAASLFAETFEAAPVAGSFAPGRINLMGEHTDYNNGHVLPVAINLGVAVVGSLARETSEGVSREAGRCNSFEAASIGPGGVRGWARYFAGMAWAFREAGLRIPNLRIAVSGDLPMGTGVSSSAALEVAVGMLWRQFAPQIPEGLDLAKLGRQCENGFLGLETGLMDQMASVMGKQGMAIHFDVRAQTVSYARIPDSWRVVLCDTQTPRSLAESKYNERVKQCRSACRMIGVESLRDATLEDVDSMPECVEKARTRHVLTDNQRVLEMKEALEAGNNDRVGQLMQESHASMRDDYEISSPALDLMQRACMESGAIGARMTGAGFGGACVALVDVAHVDDFLGEAASRFRGSFGSEGRFIACEISGGASPVIPR